MEIACGCSPLHHKQVAKDLSYIASTLRIVLRVQYILYSLMLLFWEDIEELLSVNLEPGRAQSASLDIMTGRHRDHYEVYS